MIIEFNILEATTLLPDRLMPGKLLNSGADEWRHTSFGQHSWTWDKVTCRYLEIMRKMPLVVHVRADVPGQEIKGIQ